MAQFGPVLELSSLDGSNGFKISGEAAGDYSGWSVSGAGDVNGDGFGDVVVGAPFASPSGIVYAGASYVVFGAASGFAANLDLSALDGSNGFQISGAAIADLTGQAVSAAGDVNGDGFADVIIGAPLANANVPNSGASYVVFGTASAFTANLDLSTLDGGNGFQISGEAASDQSGLSVSGAGDVNGDGFADVIIGAPLANANVPNSGASYVVFGAASGFPANLDLSALDGTNGFQISGEAAGDDSGFAVSGAGDVNGDSFADLIIAAVGADPNGEFSGASYVVFGAASGFQANLDLSTLEGSKGFQISGEAAYDRSGWSVSGAGDVNGDGFADLIIGANRAGPNGLYSGASYVVFGAASGFPENLELSALDGSNGFRISGKAAYDYSGNSVSGAGDVNGDGFADVIVGAPGRDSRSGVSYVVFGAASGFAANLDLSTLNGNNGFEIRGVAEGDEMGAHVSGAGDINGDGFADLIMGALYADANGIDSGASYIVFGRKPDVAVTRIGTNASQTLAGGDFDDTLSGLGGNDALWGHGGRDDMDGGAGRDTLRGGAGNDKLSGGADDDRLYGDAGHDLIKGGSGADLIDGGAGADIVNAGDGNDLIMASIGDGADFYYGDGGTDTVDYSALTQRVEVRLGDLFGVGTGLVKGGQSGTDVLASIENVTGSQAGDEITGNNADNVIEGAGGNDRLSGGRGDDTFVFREGFGRDKIADFDDRGNDVIWLSTSLFADFDAVQDALSVVGRDVVLRLDAANSITLQNTTLGSITESDFFFF